MDSTELPNQRPIMKILQIICFHKQGTYQRDNSYMYIYEDIYLSIYELYIYVICTFSVSHIKRDAFGLKILYDR